MLTPKALLTLPLLLTLSCAGRPRTPESQGISPSQTASAEPAVGLCSAAPQPARRARPADEGCSEAPAPDGLASKMFHQLRYHQRFPATRAQVLAGLAAAAELTAAETAWIAERLPATTLPSARDAMLALFPAAPAAGLALLAGPTALAQR